MNPFVRVSLVAVLLGVLSGCQSLYLHDDAAQAATAEAKAELDKANVGAVFDNESAYLDDLEKRESAAIADNLGARRDAYLLTLLKGGGARTLDARESLGRMIDGQLKFLAGSSDRGDGAKYWEIMDEARRQNARSGKPMAEVLADLLANGSGRVVAPPDPIGELPTPSNLTLTQAISDVKALAALRADQQKRTKEAQDSLTAEFKKAADDLAAGQASRQTFDDLLTKINALLKEAQEKANPYLGEYVSQSLDDELSELIEITDPQGLDKPGASKVRAALGLVQAALGVGDAFASPPRVPHPNALAVAQSWLQYVAGQADVERQQALATEALVNARLDAVLEQVYSLSRAGVDLHALESAAKFESGAGFDRFLADKNPATRRAATASLYYFANAWTNGFIPVQQMRQVGEPLVERRAKLQRSRQAGELWLGALKPAVSTLAAYGEGGVDAHLIAELLAVLGIGAVAVGGN